MDNCFSQFFVNIKVAIEERIFLNNAFVNNDDYSCSNFIFQNSKLNNPHEM